VLSLPWRLRYRLAYDVPLVQEVLGFFVRAVFGSLRRRARHCWGVAPSHGGAVTFVQRFADALNLNGLHEGGGHLERLLQQQDAQHDAPRDEQGAHPPLAAPHGG
jgi:hypothetical protein